MRATNVLLNLFQSAQILEKMYECPWYLCSQTFKRTFLFAQMRARKIVIVTAGKFVILNNESFLVVSCYENVGFEVVFFCDFSL